MSVKKFLFAGSTAAILGMTALVATATSASAYVACNAEGDCWHTERHTAAPGVSFTYHPDDWYFHQHWDDHHHFRDYHDGRGYYKGGVWVTL